MFGATTAFSGFAVANGHHRGGGLLTAGFAEPTAGILSVVEED